MGMVMEYNPDTDQWTRKRDMPQNLHHVALAEAGGRIYMFGGFTLPEKGKAMWVPVNQTAFYERIACEKRGNAKGLKYYFFRVLGRPQVDSSHSSFSFNPLPVLR